jgi:hypothetical protein
MALQCLRLADHVTPHSNNDISTAAVFSDIRKAFEIIWHPGPLYKLPQLHLPASIMKLISPFLSNRIFIVSVEGKLSMPREI